MDDEEYELVYELSMPSAARFRKADIVVLGLSLLHGIAAAVSDTLESATVLAAQHSNWKADQDAFHEQAALEIESLVAGEDE